MWSKETKEIKTNMGNDEIKIKGYLHKPRS